MTQTLTAIAPSDRLPIERESAGDFPYYDGRPRSLTPLQWGVVLAGVLAGFLVLIAPVPFFASAVAGFIPAILFAAVPLAALAVVAGRDWTALFRRLRGRDLLWILAIALLNIVVSLAVAVIVRQAFETAANPVGGMLGAFSGSERVIFFLRTIPQLFGEEVVSVLPFLAVLWLCSDRLGLGRKTSIVIGWLGTSLLFGALHLPTYDWNFVQCFVIIGSARAVLLIGYLATKNILVSTGAHILNDWVLFAGMMILLGRATL